MTFARRRIPICGILLAKCLQFNIAFGKKRKKEKKMKKKRQRKKEEKPLDYIEFDAWFPQSVMLALYRIYNNNSFLFLEC